MKLITFTPQSPKGDTLVQFLHWNN